MGGALWPHPLFYLLMVCLFFFEILNFFKDFKSEKDLLSGFIDLWIKLDPTIISGWNSEFFDIPYLYYRIRKVLSEDMA